MHAFQLVEYQRPAALREVPVPEPGPGQVLVKVGGAGACHSDLHIMDAPANGRAFRLPFTLGHENAGWVEQLGPGASGFEHGDPVVVYGPWGCGICARCRVGMENYCEKSGDRTPGGGLGLNDGGMAEYLLVPATRFLIPLGSLDPREAAPLSDAGLTSYHAVKRSLDLLGPGSTAVVIGTGGLGQMAIQMLRALAASTKIVAVDTANEKLETALQMGADAGLLSGDAAVSGIMGMTHGQGAEVVLDFVGINQTLQMAAQLARVLGHLTIVGIGGGALPVNFPVRGTSAPSRHRTGARSPTSWRWSPSPNQGRSGCWSSTFPWSAYSRRTAACTRAKSADARLSRRTDNQRLAADGSHAAINHSSRTEGSRLARSSREGRGRAIPNSQCHLKLLLGGVAQTCMQDGAPEATDLGQHLVGCRAANEGKHCGAPARQFRRKLAHKPVIDPVIAYLVGDRTGRRADTSANQRRVEQLANECAPERSARSSLERTRSRLVQRYCARFIATDVHEVL